jgi:hypothetical protein
MFVRNRIVRHDWRSLGLSTLLLVLGCGSPDAVVTPQGEVSYEGRAIEKGAIEFIPIDGTTGPSARAIIADGRYAVAAKWGLKPEGVYQVRITGYRKTGKKAPNKIDRNGPPIEVEENYIPAIHNAESTLKVRVAELPDKDKLDFRLTKTGIPVRT